jgi:hypothetical protein
MPTSDRLHESIPGKRREKHFTILLCTTTILDGIPFSATEIDIKHGVGGYLYDI